MQESFELNLFSILQSKLISFSDFSSNAGLLNLGMVWPPNPPATRKYGGLPDKAEYWINFLNTTIGILD